MLFICATGCAAQNIETIAGSTFTFPAAPLPAVQAPLGYVPAVAVDSAGNFYAADAGNQFVVKVNASGNLTIVAGNAGLYNPSGIAVDRAGNLFIADAGDNRVRKVTLSGTIGTVAGTGVAGYSGDGGRATAAMLSAPTGVAVDGAGNLYIADSGNQRVRMVNAAGTISSVAGNGLQGYSGDGGLATSAQLQYPHGVAADGAGKLFIADLGNHRIRVVNPAGSIATVAGNGSCKPAGDGGPATAASFCSPYGIAVGAAGDLYIADYDNANIRKVTAGGFITTVAGTIHGFGGDGGLAAGALLGNPAGVAVDRAGNLLIADFSNERVRQVTPDGIISTVAGDGGYRFRGDGAQATSALLAKPNAVATDSAGNLFIADTNNHRIRKVSTDGTITTVAGNGFGGYGGDGGPAASASLFSPGGVAVDSSDRLLIADTFNCRIRMVSAGIITTLAGNGLPIYGGDGGPAAEASFYYPVGIVLDREGNLFVADSYNERVRMVSPNGVVTTVAGNGIGGYSGDGRPATMASLLTPVAVAVDNAGNLFIADSGNNRIRQVDSGGTIATIAGTGISGNFGDGGPAGSAELSGPEGVTLDGAGNLYIADSLNNRIRMVNAAGLITTAAGTGRAGYSGDGGPAVAASLNFPSGMAIDPAGDLLIADTGNDRVRKVPAVPAATAMIVSAASGTAPVAPGSIVSIYGSNLAVSGTQATTLPLPTNLGGTSVTITDSIGNKASLPLFYAGPSQINAEIPPIASAGAATFKITTPGGPQTAIVMLAAVAPGLFTANQSGKGVAAAQLVTNESNGRQTVTDIFNAPCATGSCVGVPLDVSSGQTALVLYGTGIQNRAALAGVTVKIGSHTLPAFFAGAAPGYAGLDQVNVLLPASLAGIGAANVMVVVSGIASNVATATFR